MKDDDKKKISDILDAFDAQRKVADQTAREMQARRDIFLEAFSHQTSLVIAPALNEGSD